MIRTGSRSGIATTWSVLAGLVMTATVLWAAGSPSTTASQSRGADWPQFMGPNRDCSSGEKGLLRQWPPGGPKELWRVKTGRGWSCPSIVGGDLYIPWSEIAGESGGENTEVLACLDAVTGKEKWRFTYKAVYAYSNWGVWFAFGVRSTPTVTPRHVFTISLTGLMHGLDRKTGRMIWSKDLVDAYKPDVYEGNKGFPLSPIVSGNVVIVNLPTSSSAPTNTVHKVVGLDVDTGGQVWLFEMPHRPNTLMTQGHTPGLARFGPDECVVLQAERVLLALRCADGKEVWRSEHVKPGAGGSSLPTPLIIGNTIFHANIWEMAYLVEVDRSNPEFPTKVRWGKHLGMGISQCSNLAHWDGYLYGFRYGESPGLVGEKCSLMCVDLATGSIAWSRQKFAFSPSLIAADGLLFVRVYNGLLLLEATPKGYVEKGAVAKLVDEVPSMKIGRMGLPAAAVDGGWTIPVLSRGRLYVRCPGNLICYQVAANP